MKNIILIKAFLICILSCSKKDACKEELLALKHFESDYGCDDTRHTLIIDLINDFTIIKSKEIYDIKVTGSCHPEIDFSLYDLIIGKQSSGNLNATISYDFRRACPENVLTLTVDLFQSLLTQPDNVVYHALIPKLGAKETLSVKINVK